MKRAVFLDRDGTINVEKNYMYKLEDWEWIQEAIAAIKGFNKLGFLVIVVTNQSGIARGIYNYEDVNKLHAYVNKLLNEADARIDDYYYCPHHPDYGEIRSCNCRKPAPGLIFEAQAKYNIDLKNSYMIGDKASDIEAGYRAGTTPILVTTGYGRNEICKISKGTPIAANLFEAYKLIKGGDT